MARIGQREPAGVPQHVGMNLNFEPSHFGRSLQHPREPGGGKRGTALTHEHKGLVGSSRRNRRKARISRPVRGCVLGVPALTLRTCRSA